MVTLRKNQIEPVRIGIEYFSEKKPVPSIIVAPTAFGKSIVIAQIAKGIGEKVLVIQPSKELLEQNYEKSKENSCDPVKGKILSGARRRRARNWRGSRAPPGRPGWPGGLAGQARSAKPRFCDPIDRCTLKSAWMRTWHFTSGCKNGYVTCVTV